MGDARAEILARARRALAGSPAVTHAPQVTQAPALADAPAVATEHDLAVADTPALGRAGLEAASRALVDLFTERVSDYRATVLRTDEGGVARTIGDAIAGWGSGRIVVPDGFPAAWLPESGASWQSDDPPLSNRQLDALDGVVTLCAIGIAETGTVVLDGGGGQGRRALSLVPDRHICVIGAEQIVADVPDAIDRLNPRRALTWISGPSATSDIELQRVEGVHGPRTLVVVIVEKSVDKRRPSKSPRRSSPRRGTGPAAQ